MLNTRYAKEVVPPARDKKGHTIERIFIKGTGRQEIRFSWWKDGRMIHRPLDLPERALLRLIKRALRCGVLTSDFAEGMRQILADHPHA